MSDFTGKVALVTGAATGIGRATALAFARAGAAVVVADLAEDGGNDAVNEIKDAGAEGMFVRTDVSRAADAEAMVSAAVERFGGLDCAFNNAGMEASTLPIADVTEEEWDRLNAVNVKAKGYYYYYYPHDVETSKAPNKPNESKPAEDIAVGNR